MPVEPAREHLDRVYAVVEGAENQTQGAISASWKRSATRFGINPTSTERPRILTVAELRDHREKVESLVASAREELDHLYRIVAAARYVVLLTNERGVVIDHRGNPGGAAEFAQWGIWVGGVWAEDTEGTNGIGTCIAERLPVTIHQSQHFRSRHIGLSCSGAPIFGGGGELIGVLDVSSLDAALSEHSHALAGTLVVNSAHAIEERYFREAFRRHWIVAVAPSDAVGGPILWAVDKDRRVVGANRHARPSFLPSAASLESGVSFWAFYERDERIFREKEGGADATIALIPLGGTAAVAALLTPPEAAAAVWRTAENARLHSRPRINLLTGMRPPEQTVPASGGLPPRVLRRVQDYIDAHLDEAVELDGLAAIAGLSLHHFAHAFKTSAGVAPHGYLLQRRIDKARDLLIHTEQPVADIALAAGFADQSHLARHFRQSLGVSPGAFRRSYR